MNVIKPFMEEYFYMKLDYAILEKIYEKYNLAVKKTLKIN